MQDERPKASGWFVKEDAVCAAGDGWFAPVLFINEDVNESDKAPTLRLAAAAPALLMALRDLVSHPNADTRAAASRAIALATLSGNQSE